MMCVLVHRAWWLRDCNVISILDPTSLSIAVFGSVRLLRLSVLMFVGRFTLALQYLLTCLPLIVKIPFIIILKSNLLFLI